MERMFKGRMRKVASALCAGALGISMTVGSAAPALAATVAKMNTGGNVTATTTPFSSSFPEFLGIDTVDERWGITSTSDKVTNGAQGLGDEFDDNTSGALRYILMGSSVYNSNPDPYMYNTLYNTDGEQTIQNSKRSSYTSTNMNRALGTTADTDLAIWAMKPDIILGVLDSNNNVVNYADAVEQLKERDSEKYANYEPVGVTTDGTVTEIFYRMAAAADKVVADSNGKKKLRYGNATNLAKNYESIIVGSQGYLLSQMEKRGLEKRRVAIVSANDGENVTLTTEYSGVAAGLANVSINVANEKVEGDAKTVAIPIAQLGDLKPDLIVIMTNDVDRNNVKPTGLEAYYDKLYWTADSDCGTIGSDKQGADVAQNYGRLYGCLYPEIFDQSDWVAYYYDTVYHIKADKLGAAIDKAMDGVRNWDVKSGSNGDAYLQWSANTASDYNRAEVKSMIDYGVAYIKANPVESITPTETLLATAGNFDTMEDPGAASIADATVAAIANQTWTGKALTPAVTVTLDGKTLVKDTDYTIAYTNNTNVGTATVTITGKGVYKGSKTATFKIVGNSIATATVSSIPAQTYTGKAITPALTVKLGNTTLKKDTDYTVSYTNNTKVGTATVTIRGKGNYAGTKKASFKINAISMSGAKVTLEKTSYLALGSAITPAATVKVGGTTLKKGTDYTVSYANNTKAGTATVTIKGKGNYTGTKKATFKINAVTPANAPAVTGTWKKSGSRWVFTIDSKSKKALGTSKSNLTNMWLKIGGKKYHFDVSGKMHSGWQKISNAWYYLGSDGAMKTGWKKISGKWYYMNTAGKMLTGKNKIGSATYFLTSSGAMKTGWNKESGKWYYYKSSGAMAKNTWIGNYWVGSDGKMATSSWVDGGKYYVNASGAWVKGKTK